MHQAQDLPRLRQRKSSVPRGLILRAVHPCWYCGRFQIEARYCSQDCRRAYIDSVIVRVG